MLQIQALRQQAVQQAARITGWLDQQALVRRVVVIATLLGALALSWRPSLMVAGAIYGGLAVLWLARRPKMVVPALILFGALAPTTIRAGRDGRINAAMLVVAAFLGAELVRILVRKEVRLRPSPANVPWLVLIILAGLSIVAGSALWNPWVVTKDNFILVQLSQWSLYLLAAGAYFFSGTQLDKREQLQNLLRVVLILGVLRLLFWLGLEERVWRLGILGGPIVRIWIVTVAGACALFIPGLRSSHKAALAGMAGFTVLWPLFFARDWASGWIPSTVGAAVIGFLWIWRRSSRAATFVYVLGIFGTPVLVIVARGLAAADNWSLETRFIAVRGLVQLLEGRWILGLGLAAYWHYWQHVLGSISYRDPETGYFHYAFTNAGIGVNTHNQYLDVLGQMGILGLLAFLWLLAMLLYQALRSFRAEAPGFGQAYAAACVGGITGMIVAGLLGDWIIPFVYNIGLNGFRDSFLAWILLGGLSLLDATRGQEGASVTDPGPAVAPAAALPIPHPPAPPRAPA